MLNIILNIAYWAAETFFLHKKSHSSYLKSFVFATVSNSLLGIIVAAMILSRFHTYLPAPPKTFFGYFILGLGYGVFNYLGKYLLAKFVFKLKIEGQFDYFGLTVISAVALSLATFVSK